MKVFLTGATGVMGRSSIQALHESGHTVVGLVRSPEGAARISQLGAEPHQGNLFDVDQLQIGMQGCDVVANLATSVPVGVAQLYPGAWRRNDRIRTEGAQTVVAAARAAGVGRVIQQSLSYVYGDNGDDWIDEDSPIDITKYVEPVVLAEAQAEAFGQQCGDGVSLRFGLITGSDPQSAFLLQRARAGKPIGMGSRDGWCHVIHPDDVGSAVVAALSAPSGIYNVGAEPIRRGDLADVIARVAGRDKGTFYGQLFMKLAGQKVESFTRSQRVNSGRLSERTGWHPAHPKVGPDWFELDE